MLAHIKEGSGTHSITCLCHSSFKIFVVTRFASLDIRKKLELSRTLPQFQMCCANARTMLAPLRYIPTETRNLLIRNDAFAKRFKANIKTHNSVPLY